MTLEPTKVSELLALLENADRDAPIQFCMAGNESLKFEVWERNNAEGKPCITLEPIGWEIKDWQRIEE